MIEAPFAIAFAAGLVATLNPCGFAMLPAYLSYFMGLGAEEEATRPDAFRRALVIGAVMSSAFLLVFGAFGIAITAGFRAVIDWIPWIALGVGFLVAALGVAMLFGYELSVGLPKAKRAGKGNGLRSVFGFGVSYGVASLSCTLPVFLSVVASQLTVSSFASGVATFVVYGIGMSMMLVAVTLVMAFGRQSMVRRLRSTARYINRVAGGVLVLAGAYIVWFWGTNLGSGSEALGGQGLFTFTETLSQRATDLFGDHALAWGLGFGAVILAAVVYALRSGRSRTARPARTRLASGLVAALLIVAVAVVVGESATTREEEGQVAAQPRGPMAPISSFDMFDGSTASLGDYRGTPIVLNFWASWCPSCVAELSAAIKPVQDRFGGQVVFIGVNLQDEREVALALVERTGVEFELAEDLDGQLYVEFGAIGMPFTAFISADGEVVEKHNGPLTEGRLTERLAANFAVVAPQAGQG